MSESNTQERLDRLLNYLQHDPNNQSLLTDILELVIELKFEPSEYIVERLTASGNLTANAQYLVAIWLMQRLRWTEAAHYLEELINGDHEQQAIRVTLAQCYAYDNKMMEAYLTLSPLIKQNEISDRATLLLAAQVCHHAHSYSEAIQLLQTMHDMYPDNSEALGLFALIQADLGNYEKARIYSNRALDTDPGSYSALLAQADVRLQQQDFLQAASEYEHVISIREDSGRAWYGLGLTQLLIREPIKAETSLSKARMYMSVDAHWYQSIAWAQLFQAKEVDALNSIKEGQKRFPDNLELRATEACILLLGEQSESGMKVLDHLVDEEYKSLTVECAKAIKAMGLGDAKLSHEIIRDLMGEKNSFGISYQVPVQKFFEQILKDSTKNRH